MGILNKAFFHIGFHIASNPCTSCFFALMMTLVFCLGFLNFSLTNDPVDLWVPPASRANIEQNFFNEHFGAFYRIDTFYLTPKDEANKGYDLFQKPYLEILWYIQEAIKSAQIENNNFIYTLDDFCYKPISGEGCLVTSPLEYYQDDLEKVEAIDMTEGSPTNPKTVAQCIPSGDDSERVCFDSIGVPVMSFAIFGNITCEEDSGTDCDPCIIDASGLQVSFLLTKNSYSFETAQQWEDEVFQANIKSFNHILGYQDELKEDQQYNQTLIDQVQGIIDKYRDQGIELIDTKIEFLSERSIEDEVEEEGSQNAFVVIISYLMMFAYVGIAIGFFPSFVHNKFLLALAGIGVVIASVLSSMGITFYADIPLTMISAEVVPFLVLAIGVDNMFLISRAERTVPSHIKDVPLRMGYALKEIGPSIFAAAFCEALAFFVGMLTDVPALWSFCLVAALAVIVDFLLQFTLFLPALTFDVMRVQKSRADIIPCITVADTKPPRKEVIRNAFKKHFVPFVFNPWSEILIISLAALLFVTGVCSCVKIKLGLNQNVSLIEGSDLTNYFDTLFYIGEAGPPAYLVFNNINYTIQDNLDYMSQIQVELASLSDTVISPIYSWVSMFENYVDPSGVWSGICGSASVALLNFDDQMQEFIKVKVESDCCQQYGICGEQFAADISFDDDGKVVATRFRFQLQPLQYQSDYIDGLVLPRRATDEFAKNLITNVDDDEEDTNTDELFQKDYFEPPFIVQAKNAVMNFLGINSLASESDSKENESEYPYAAYTYSLYYIYYDQYTYIEGILVQNTLLALAGILFALQILNSFIIAVLISLCVFFVMFELMGCMWMLNMVLGGYPIEMNAVFVVNLITGLGLGVEFCNHVGMNFMRQTGTKEARAKKALAELGSSVLVGIASTKFIGVIVMAFAPSTIFRLYYFRMYLFIIFLGCFNGLMVLPILLKYLGPDPDRGDLKEDKETKEEFKKLEKRELFEE